MNASTLTRTLAPVAGRPNGPSRTPARAARPEVRPAMPDERLWKTDNERAFEAAIEWFLAVSRTA